MKKNNYVKQSKYLIKFLILFFVFVLSIIIFFLYINLEKENSKSTKNYNMQNDYKFLSTTDWVKFDHELFSFKHEENLSVEKISADKEKFLLLDGMPMNILSIELLADTSIDILVEEPVQYFNVRDKIKQDGWIILTGEYKGPLFSSTEHHIAYHNVPLLPGTIRVETEQTFMELKWFRKIISTFEFKEE